MGGSFQIGLMEAGGPSLHVRSTQPARAQHPCVGRGPRLNTAEQGKPLVQTASTHPVLRACCSCNVISCLKLLFPSRAESLHRDPKQTSFPSVVLSCTVWDHHKASALVFPPPSFPSSLPGHTLPNTPPHTMSSCPLSGCLLAEPP